MEIDIEEDTMMKDELKVETEAEIKIKNEHEQEKFQKNLVAKFLDQIDLTSGSAITISGQNYMKKEEQIEVNCLMKQA